MTLLISNHDWHELNQQLRNNEGLRSLDIYADYEIPDDERDGYIELEVKVKEKEK
jgi:hypothetical protein